MVVTNPRPQGYLARSQKGLGSSFFLHTVNYRDMVFMFITFPLKWTLDDFNPIRGLFGGIMGGTGQVGQSIHNILQVGFIVGVILVLGVICWAMFGCIPK